MAETTGGGATGPKLLDRVRTAIRVEHLSYRTEKAYLHWIRSYILFHGKRHPMAMGEREVTAFLSHLAEEKNVSPSTQNQALAAILYLYRTSTGGCWSGSWGNSRVWCGRGARAGCRWCWTGRR